MSSNRPKVYIDGHVGTTGLRIRTGCTGAPTSRSFIFPRRAARIRRRAAHAWRRPTWRCSACRTTRRAKRRRGLRGERNPGRGREHRAPGGGRTGPTGCRSSIPAGANGSATPGASRIPVAIRAASCSSSVPWSMRDCSRRTRRSRCTPCPATPEAAVRSSNGGSRRRRGSECLPFEAPYALDRVHKHIPEMTRYAGLVREPQFLPAVGPFRCGMRVQVPIPAGVLAGDGPGPRRHRTSGPRVREVLTDRYAGEPSSGSRPGPRRTGRVGARSPRLQRHQPDRAARVPPSVRARPAGRDPGQPRQGGVGRRDPESQPDAGSRRGGRSARLGHAHAIAPDSRRARSACFAERHSSLLRFLDRWREHALVGQRFPMAPRGVSRAG